MRYFEYEHVVGFAETNLVGNVYFAHYIAWQGRCRELFLHRHCPQLLASLDQGMALLTTSCGCEYLDELRAMDRVSVRMSLVELVQNRVTMGFDYWRQNGAQGAARVARGEQQVAFLQRRADGLEAVPVPDSLRRALEPYHAR